MVGLEGSGRAGKGVEGEASGLQRCAGALERYLGRHVDHGFGRTRHPRLHGDGVGGSLPRSVQRRTCRQGQRTTTGIDGNAA